MASDLGFVAVVLIVVLIHFGVYSRVNRWFNPNKDSLRALTQKKKEDRIKYDLFYHGKGAAPSFDVKRVVYEYTLGESVVEVSWAFLQLKSVSTFLESHNIETTVVTDLEGTSDQRVFLCFRCADDKSVFVENFPKLVVSRRPFKLMVPRKNMG